MVSSGELNVQGKQFGGEAVFTGHMDGDFVAEVQVRLNSGKDASLYFRYLDPDHWYRARLQGTPVGAVFLEKMHKGKLTTLDSAAAFPSDPDVLRVKCVGSALEVWYNPAGTPGAATLSATDGDIGWGGVALSGWDALFDNLKVGYDADDDDDLDGSDDVVIDEDFSSTSVAPTHDDAGNLTKDADYAYGYDAWNNLVKVRAQNDADVVVGVYAYYADNRRASKTVTNRGDLDGTTYFFYDGLREIEERNGAEAVTQQYVWGHEYLDQLLMIRGAGGTWFVHQDANWNVIALTTPGGDVAEEVQYQPYGLPQVRRHLAFGDSDADGDVDASDNTARTNALSTYNRAFDADFDGDVVNTSGDADKEAWDASYNDPAASTTTVVANRGFSPTGNPFLFTGRRLDAETGLYHYRFRTYHPVLKQFIQRDPLGYGASGPSLYQYIGSRPTYYVDPLGACGEGSGSRVTPDNLKEQLQNALRSGHLTAEELQRFRTGNMRTKKAILKQLYHRTKNRIWLTFQKMVSRPEFSRVATSSFWRGLGVIGAFFALENTAYAPEIPWHLSNDDDDDGIRNKYDPDSEYYNEAAAAEDYDQDGIPNEDDPVDGPNYALWCYLGVCMPISLEPDMDGDGIPNHLDPAPDRKEEIWYGSQDMDP